ncbi:MAG: LON peptidase substrate-binding domain-containing protein [Acidobacteriota bacterium]
MGGARPPELPSLPRSVPVFPLPSVVFFPGTVVPLHVFEPRYRLMVRDARAGSGFIALALLKPGWEPEYYGSPEVHSIGCAGRLLEVVDLPAGRFNIKLTGICRVRFLSFESESPYRVARVHALHERIPDEERADVKEARMGLVGAYALFMAKKTGQPAAGIEGAATAPLQTLVNTLCAQMDLPPPKKQKLLRMDDILERCLVLTEFLAQERRNLLPRGGESPGGGSPTVH